MASSKPHQPSRAYSDVRPSAQILDDTITLFQHGYPDHPFTHEDVRKILANLTGFFQVLRDWQRKDRLQLRIENVDPNPDTETVSR